MNSKLLIVLVLVTAALVLWYYRKNPLSAKIEIGGNRYTVEVAVTATEKAKGLSFRDSMPADHAMIFLYDHKDFYEFWMNGMRFSLDFIWLDGNTIVDITQNVQIPSGATMPIIKPALQADKILELNAGVVARDGIKIGETVKFLN